MTTTIPDKRTEQFILKARAAVLLIYSDSAVWDTRYLQFFSKSGIRDHCLANKLYYKYLDSGTIDEQKVITDYMKLYQEWIETLVSHNCYTEIQSYQDWYVWQSEQEKEE